MDSRCDGLFVDLVSTSCTGTGHLNCMGPHLAALRLACAPDGDVHTWSADHYHVKDVVNLGG